MASLRFPSDAIDFAGRFVKNMPIKQVQKDILQQALNAFWMAAPWRWTIGAFPSVALASNTQDFAPTLPSDFLYLYDPYIVDTSGNTVSGANAATRIHVVPSIVPAGQTGMPPTQVAVTGTPGSPGVLRVQPKLGTIPNTWTLFGLYKKQAPVFTNTNIFVQGTQVFDDEYFWIFESGVLYLAYLYADDQRAGSVQFDKNGRVQFTGQRGVFEGNLQWMREREKMLITAVDRPDIPIPS